MIKLKFLWTLIILYSACSAPFFISFPFLVKPANVFGSQRFTFRDQVLGVNVPASSLVSEHILTVSLAFCLESTKARVCGGGFSCCFFYSLTKDLMYAPENLETLLWLAAGGNIPLYVPFWGTDVLDYRCLPEAGRFLRASRISLSFHREGRCVTSPGTTLNLQTHIHNHT